MAHPKLRTSLALKIFLTEETKKRFELKKKDLKKFFGKYIKISKNLTKKQYDSIADKNPIANYPNHKEFTELKISSILKKYYVAVDGKFLKYSEIFGRLIKLHKEYSKHMEKSI